MHCSIISRIAPMQWQSHQPKRLCFLNVFRMSLAPVMSIIFQNFLHFWFLSSEFRTWVEPFDLTITICDLLLCRVQDEKSKHHFQAQSTSLLSSTSPSLIIITINIMIIVIISTTIRNCSNEFGCLKAVRVPRSPCHSVSFQNPSHNDR